MTTGTGSSSQVHAIVLTFDDGPHPDLTPQLLGVLADKEVRAVLFVLGKSLQTPQAMEIVKLAHSRGHIIGNHAYSHGQLSKMTPQAIEEELTKTDALIAPYQGAVKLFRPPYGERTAAIKNAAAKIGCQSVFWDVDPRDWDKKLQPDGWIDEAITQLKARGRKQRSVVLLHDIHKTTVEGTGTLIDRIRDEISGATIVPYA